MQQLAKCKNICENTANAGISSMCGLFLATTTCSANLVLIRFYALHSEAINHQRFAGLQVLAPLGASIKTHIWRQT